MPVDRIHESETPMSDSRERPLVLPARKGRRQGSVLIDQVADWLMERALGTTEQTALLAGCCDRLFAAGIPISRVHIAYRTLHPVMQAMGLRWRHGEGIETLGFRHDEGPEEFQRSPHFFMIRSGISLLRRRLTGPEAETDFDMLVELQAEGYTDYLAFVEAFDDQVDDGIIGSWVSSRPDGFNETDIGSLLRIQQRLAVAFKAAIREQITRNIVDTYLGPEAGRQVLSGQIQRGDHESIHAVIWYGDLRDSTHMSETLSPDAYLAMLNSYFDCTAGSVIAEGGEVLLLLGDAVLAIFRTGEDAAAQAAARALAAAQRAQAAIADLNRRREEAGEAALACGIGLHVGEVMFGNIGVPERLQFTVIGPAVNEVARLEDLAKELGRPVLASRAFVALCGGDWQSLGRFPRPGVPQPIEVLAPKA
jgi:adenylate cyclase